MLLKVKARNFRIYDTVQAKLGPCLNFFFGDNGQGKTAFLEILFVALRGRSFRPFSKDAFIKEGQQEASILLSFHKGSSFFLEVFFEKTNKGLHTRAFLNEKKISFSFLKKELPCLVFTEEEIDCIKGPSEKRRNLVDHFLSFRGEEPALQFFRKTLKEKTSLLRSYKKGLCSRKEAFKTLEVLNQSFLKSSEDLLKKRLFYLGELKKKLETSPFLLSEAGLFDFKSLFSGKEMGQEESLFFLKESLKENLLSELDLGLPLTGPQKQEILFLFRGRNSRTHSSQGQQRALVLSLLLSEVRGVEKPLLFLDDLLSELDEKTQKKLLLFLEKTDCQAFLTACKKVSLPSKKSWFFRVKWGTIEPCNYDGRVATNEPSLRG